MQYHQSHSSTAGSWGLLRNTFQEFPGLSFSGTDSHLAAPRQLPGLQHADAFGVAVGGCAVATPRMLPEQASRAPTGPVLPLTGSMLITGGLGGLGTLFAQQAVHQGTAKLLLSDTTPARAVPRQLADSWTESCFVSGDISCAANAAELAALAGPVQQVLHAAGVLQDRLLLKQTAASFRAVLSSKVGCS